MVQLTTAQVAGSFVRHQLKPLNCSTKLSLKPYYSPGTHQGHHHHPPAPSLAAMKPLEEADVGITCYISKLPGFRGILKQRYSDFVVNEVDLDEKVVHLTSLEAPLEMVEEKETKISDVPKTSYSTEIESFRALAGDSNADSLKGLLEQISSGVEDSAEPIILSPSSDKVHRTGIHNFFKERLKFLVTDTVDGPDPLSKCVRVRFDFRQNNGRNGSSRKRKGRGDNPYDSRGSDNWPEHLGKFLRFHLYKENKDTQEALGLIGKMLGIQPQSFGFSGTKDKRSVSTQRVTVFKQRASRLAALNGRLIGIKVGDFCHVKEGLLLGQLYGNRFTITLRGVVADSEDTIRASAEALGTHGFINYFGLQRFGSGSVPTYLIGAKLLRGEWKAAVNMILDPREGEKDAVKRVREYYKESDDIEGTLRQLPRYLVAERALLQCLMKCPGNYLQALKAIPRTLRMMYVHSYQSYLWNHAASMRVQNHGIDEVVLGDLVYCKEENSENAKPVLDLGCEEESCNDTYDPSQDEVVDTDSPEERRTLVKAVNEEDIVSGNYTIEDVLLPLPGSRVSYPVNDIGKIFQELADKDGIRLAESVHSIKEFSLTSMTGAYRRVFQKPKDFEWELLSYTDENIPLTVTDLDSITNIRATSMVENNQANNNEHAKSSSNCKLQSGSSKNDLHILTENDEASLKQFSRGTVGQESQIALKMAFTLPASCYATMAIRELLKTSTSAAFHKTLNR